MSADYIIGIDLGTTNSVLAYAPLAADKPEVSLLTVPQLTAPSTIENRTSLPSFVYLGHQRELESGSLDLPWEEQRAFAVGEIARAQSAQAPQRTVGAAKSWLCYSRVDRRAPILPWDAPEDVEKISPTQAAQLYLEHLIAAWDSTFPDAPLRDQRVVLTVPASFDAVACELTREAALAAGLPDDLLLLEEPQAAIYAWLDAVGDDWRKILKVGSRLLVCDVGGGTTDLSLVEVIDEDGELTLQRRAVGEHLLVGGDNMDLALAHHVAGLFSEKGVKLDPWQSVSLWHSCRAAKESLLEVDGERTHSISVLGRGRKLIGGTVSVEVERDAVTQLLLDGFLPECKVTDRPQRQRASGFQEIGLPFESDTAITRHLASFLASHGEEETAAHPTHLLFNGGVFKAGPLRDRLVEILGNWQDNADGVRVLDDFEDLDNSVARGATYYGWSKEHGGVRIRGGVARSYYIGIETAGLAIPGAPRPLKALCVLPFGLEEGSDVEVPSAEIGLVLGEPAEFRFFSSATRKNDEPGQLLDAWDEDELNETDSMEATLPAVEGLNEPYVPVQFQSKVNELGMFELWCVAKNDQGKWKLEFNVRDEDD